MFFFHTGEQSNSCYINTPEQGFTEGGYKLFKSLKVWLYWNSTYQHCNGKSWQTLQLVSHWVSEQPGLLRFITDAEEQDNVIAVYCRCLSLLLSFSLVQEGGMKMEHFDLSCFINALRMSNGHSWASTPLLRLTWWKQWIIEYMRFSSFFSGRLSV